MGGTGTVSGLVALLLLAVTAISTICGEIVQVKTPREGDSTQPCVFPRHFSSKISSQRHASVSLFLKRNDVTLASRDVVLMSSNEDGGIEFDKNNVMHTAEAYHSYESSASFMLKCRLHTDNNKHYFLMEGSFFRQGRKFLLVPTDADVVMTPTSVTVSYMMTETREFDSPGDHGFVALETGKLHRTVKHKERVQRLTRHRRATTEYFIDILPVIDYGLYQIWLTKNNNSQAETSSAISIYLGNLFTSVVMRLGTLNLQNDISLKLSVLSPYLSTSVATSPYSEDNKEASGNGGIFQVNATKMLGDFRSWVSNTSGLPAHDHAMLLSALNFYGGTDGGKGFNITKGLAYVGTVCLPDGDSSSIVEDTGAYQSEGVATHEFGHCLGALHDGQDNQCNSFDRYVMSNGTYLRNSGNAGNSWGFSSCSSDYISTKITELEGTDYLNSCLKASSGQTPNTVTTKNINDQCSSLYGPESFVCRGKNFLPLSELCDDLYCRIPGTNSCGRLYSPAGICCGNGKYCLNGQCVSTSKSGCVIDEFCPLGDQPGIVVDGKTCAQMNSAHCYNSDIRIKCCATCKQRETGNRGCLYGDKQLGCNAQSCGGTLPNGLSYDVICCTTCTKNCVDRVNINRDGQNYTCSQYIDRFGISECYSSTLHDSACCESCENNRTDNPSCPFGDNLVAYSCNLLPALGRKCTAQEESYCCETCPVLAQITTAPTQAPTQPETTGGNQDTNCKSGSVCDLAEPLRSVDRMSLVLMSSFLILIRKLTI